MTAESPERIIGAVPWGRGFRGVGSMGVLRSCFVRAIVEME
jgi:hypothetical protein